ncbi:CRISPR system Cascade subunit CasA [Ruminococcus sp. YE71]|uniref:type I-E CRISPR-associated protein Cse1/CasA n=1 Tax=unclassified Ruminococcus TaxID=2608920 RepID=UPI00088C96D8|nr:MULTISPECIES: type I-E CRISPR-associated protein Cse1/CasA [unclassified Ruminococcus]SDA32271.1 CRISPR system Cascade subunit CasA [Ruminococcus sp. YE78]SFW53124.1 CRISPR system Cascade subunit CasA [Ruminococcus sp. YE71]
MEREFCLITEPWIKVMKADKNVKEVSLSELFNKAHEYLCLAGETKSQDFAVLRFLLAIIYTVFSRYDENGNEIDTTDDDYDPVQLWKNIWAAGKMPTASFEKYFDKWKERFWLFDEEYPFYQSKAVNNNRTTNKDELNPYGTKKLIGSLSQSENKNRLFSDRDNNGILLEYSEAARWLINLHCFDDTSIGPKDKILGPKKTWCSIIGGIFLSGKNLFETIMLNYVANADLDSDSLISKPFWEKDNNFKHSELIAVPNNQAELLSLQTRGAYFSRNDNKVTGVFLSGGYYFEENDVFIEQMTLWQAQKNKQNINCFEPKTHDMTKAVWREFGSIAVFPLNTQNDSSKGIRTPGIIRWYQYLIRKRIIPSNNTIHITTVCFANKGDSSYLITDYSSDELSFHSALLENIGANWRNRINDEISKIEKVAGLIANLSISLQKIKGYSENEKENWKTKELKRRLATMQFYDRIDRPFRQWLESIDPEIDDMDDKTEKLDKTVFIIAKKLGNELALQAGNSAIFGRYIKTDSKSKSRPVTSSAEALNRFIASLNNIFGNGGDKNDKS